MTGALGVSCIGASSEVLFVPGYDERKFFPYEIPLTQNEQNANQRYTLKRYAPTVVT